MRATFIDCYIKGNDIVLWLKQGKNNLRVLDSFVPEVFVAGRALKALRKKFLKHGIRSYFAKKKSFFQGTEVQVLRVPIYDLSRYHKTVAYIESLEGYALELCNADLKLEEAYLFHKGLFPTAEVEFKTRAGRLVSIKSMDDPERIDYNIPEFTRADIKIRTAENLNKTLNTKLLALEYNGSVYKDGEKKILSGFKKAFQSQDPDVLWTDNGNLLLPFLKQKFKAHGIDFDFNRFEKDDFSFEKGEFYWTYSQVVYRNASIFLKGRLHFDTKAFFADDTGFHGIIDASRICRQRIQRTEMRSAGAAVTSCLLYEAHKNGFLLPYKVGLYERFKTLGDLYEADRGSLIFEPRTGFHTDTAEFDFVSLYPQIMWRYNLSPETLFCPCCPYNKVPGLRYHYCMKKRGIVSQVAEKLIKRRMALKKIGSPEAKEKADYLKWLLVTMFGYQAFKNRKIGIIESHESIQAYAREIILKTVRVAEELGWEVVHGIVDSVYVKKKGRTSKDIEALEKEIRRETGMLLKHEGNYRWIVFLPSVINESQPISNHFYGIFENGEVKCRGIEARRKDAPKIVGLMQRDMIDLLARAKTEQEFRALIPEALKVLKNCIKALPHTAPENLAIIRKLRKVDYKNNIPQKLILEQMSEDGWDIEPGQAISYVIQDFKNKDPKKRYIPLDSYKGRFDRAKYTELLIRAAFNILQPFSISEKDVKESVTGSVQKGLEEFAEPKPQLKSSATSSSIGASLSLSN